MIFEKINVLNFSTAFDFKNKQTNKKRKTIKNKRDN